MHEPFFPLPLPSAPERGLGTLLARLLGRLLARLRRRPRPPAARRSRDPRLAHSRSRPAPSRTVGPLGFPPGEP